MRAVEGSGLERCACGFPLRGVDHWYGLACAGGPSAFIFVPSVSTHHLRRCLWRKNWVHLADSEHVAKIDSLILEMNKVGYVVGTKSELLENNVVTKEGGFIGIGKIKKLSDDLNLNYFTYNSKTDLNYILIGSRNIKLITSHPSSSFQLIKSQENVIDSLIILQKEEFWQNSKFLVIEVK